MSAQQRKIETQHYIDIVSTAIHKLQAMPALVEENKMLKEIAKYNARMGKEFIGDEREVFYKECVVCIEQNKTPTVLLHANKTCHLVCHRCAMSCMELKTNCPICRQLVVDFSNLF